ncbi:formate dehydrogenase accessory sulfurtransferase FdhD [Pseudomaricurvus alcaniphilus]|nr:formate dehydrogenase accessory sulfurtransferase FdhD [Pseudomaricurvus alcaniphilus]
MAAGKVPGADKVPGAEKVPLAKKVPAANKAPVPEAVAGIKSARRSVWNRGELSTDTDQVVTECPVALVYNGISHVVMMVTPVNLREFALGFSLSEGILESAAQLLDFEVNETELGLELALIIPSRQFAGLKARRRNLTGRTGCGLCGAESLQQAIVQPRSVNSDVQVTHEAIDRAIGALQQHQLLQQQTGAVHAAAWCDAQGEILLLREDVGRHNALDKLLGALQLHEASKEGFVLITSRASYEMVTKTASANVAVLVAVSAATSLAIEMAEQCGIALVGFSQPGRHAVYSCVERISTA